MLLPTRATNGCLRLTARALQRSAADEQMVRTVKHQATLLLRGLCWDEPHVGAGDRLANRLCVSHVVLLSLDIGLYVSRFQLLQRQDRRQFWRLGPSAGAPTGRHFRF